MNVHQKIQIERFKIKIEEARVKLGKVILLILLTLFVIDEIKAICDIMTETRIVSLVEAKAETGSIVSPIRSSVIETEQVGKTQASTDQPDIYQKIRDTFPEDPITAIAVMKAESQGDCSRVGDQHLKFTKNGVEYGASYGCFQIRHLEGRPDPKNLLDANFNINYAHQMFLAQGWKPWSAYNNGAYLKYL